MVLSDAKHAWLPKQIKVDLYEDNGIDKPIVFEAVPRSRMRIRMVLQYEQRVCQRLVKVFHASMDEPVSLLNQSDANTELQEYG